MSTRQVIADSFRAAKARAYVRVIGANREPSWIITEVALPVLAISAYIFIYRAIGAPKEYESLVVVGGAMIPYWMVVLWSMAAQFFWEKQMGNLDLYLASPMHMFSLLLGMAIGGMFMASVRTISILTFGVLVFDVQFEITNFPLAALIFMLTLTALFAMGMAASSIFFLVGRAGIKINIALMEPVFLLSGIYFPVKNLGFVLSIFASAIPLTLGLDGVRQLVLPNGPQMGFLSPAIEAAILTVMSIVFTILAFWLINRMEERGKRSGALTLKWQ
jgi:ABC-2 type transport system permease protein